MCGFRISNVRIEMRSEMFITPSPFGEGWGEVKKDYYYLKGIYESR